MFERFPHLSRTKHMTTERLALVLAGIEPMEVPSIEDAQRGNFTGWNEAKAYKEALIQAAIDGEIEGVRYFVRSGHYRVDNHGNHEELGNWINAPLPPDIDPYAITEVELVVASAQRWFNADTSADKESTTAEPTLNGLPPLSGEVYQKLLSAYQAFPIQFPEFPDYQDRKIPIATVRHWLEKKNHQGGKCSDAEARVFASILADTFGLRGD